MGPKPACGAAGMTREGQIIGSAIGYRRPSLPTRLRLPFVSPLTVAPGSSRGPSPVVGPGAVVVRCGNGAAYEQGFGRRHRG
jgi:hypothetical protein